MKEERGKRRMNLKWGVFGQIINESQLLEAKIEWALRLGMKISFCEGCHPHYKKVNEKGLSVDGTTEILESYTDRIKYEPLGRVPNQAILRDKAYKNLPQDIDIVIMSDIDEFFLEKDLQEIDDMFSADNDLKLVLTNSYIFLDNEFCAPHIQRKEGNPIEFNKNLKLYHGQFHERIFRYSKFYGYNVSPFLINDLFGRNLFNNPIYFGERELRDDIYLLHYKQFKLSEAKERHEMYRRRGDKQDYNKEWNLLEKNKIRYEGKHPIEIERLIK